MRSRKKSRETAGVRPGQHQSGSDETTGTSAASAVPDAAPTPIDAPPTQASDDVTAADTRASEVMDDRPTDSPTVEPPPPAIVVEAPEPAEPTDARELFAHLKQRVLEMPNDVNSRLRLADLHDMRSEPLLALEQHQAAAAIDPSNAAVTLRYAQALTDLNRFAEAERELHRVLKLEPDHGGLHLQLGTISYRRGLYSQAEVELKRAIELMPDAASAYFHRGESLNQLSRLDEALDMLERGVALDPNYSRAYYIMGILYDRKSRPQEAGAMYKKAREVSGT